MTALWIWALVNDSIPPFEQMLVDLNIASTFEGKYRWKLRADTLYDYGKTYVVYNLVLSFYEDGRVSSTIVADSGIMDKATRNMKALGNVVVATYDSIYLETDILIWDEHRERIYTEDTVLIIQGDRKVKGIGFESDPSLRHIVIRRQVYGEGRDRISE